MIPQKFPFNLAFNLNFVDSEAYKGILILAKAIKYFPPEYCWEKTLKAVAVGVIKIFFEAVCRFVEQIYIKN